MSFASPWLLLLLILPALRLWARWRAARRADVAIAWVDLPPAAPGADGIEVRPTARVRLAFLPAVLEAVGLTLVVLALARPQWSTGKEEILLRSRNLIIALDISSSMKATDFEPGNRLEAAKYVLREFVKRREGDLVGLVIFSGKAFLQAPLTSDVNLIARMLDQTDLGQLPDGTAIGTAIAVSLNQIKQLPATSSAIILITDGANNTGEPKLPVATEAARALGVRVHAIGLTAADTMQYALNSVWSVRTKASKLSEAAMSIPSAAFDCAPKLTFAAPRPCAMREPSVFTKYFVSRCALSVTREVSSEGNFENSSESFRTRAAA